MATELRIKWEGSLPSIDRQRLSLAAFGEPLNQLLSALRRIASNIVTDAMEANSAGRVAAAAKQIDIEITEVMKASTGFDSVITMLPPVGENMFMFQDLPERATFRLLEAIDQESKAQAANARVRSYLASLPPQINHQTYTLHSNGTVKKTVSFGSIQLAQMPQDLPSIIKCSGTLAGVGFSPPSVKIKPDGQALTFTATEAQIEKALELRRSQIQAVAVCRGDSRRLLILQGHEEKINTSTREIAVFEKWSGLLSRLAK